MSATCAICSRPIKWGELCDGHKKRQQLGKVVHVELRAANRTPFQVLADAALTFADADSEDDQAYDRAADNLGKAALNYARRWAKKGGRPPRFPAEHYAKVLAAVQEAGSIRAAAKRLEVGRSTLHRYIARCGS